MHCTTRLTNHDIDGNESYRAFTRRLLRLDNWKRPALMMRYLARERPQSRLPLLITTDLRMEKNRSLIITLSPRTLPEMVFSGVFASKLCALSLVFTP